MPGTRPAPPIKTIRFAVSGVMPGGANWANVFWSLVDLSTAHFSSTELSAWLAQVVTAYETNLGPQICNDVTITSYKGIAYNPDGSAISAERTYTHTGGNSGTMLPDQVASVISWRIDAAWRGGKPRTYLPGVTSEELVDPAHLDTTPVSDRMDAAQGFLDDINATKYGVLNDEVALGTVSFFSGNAPRSPALFFPYVDVFVNARLDTMRRRLGR